MRIEKNYYDIMLQEAEKIENEIKQENSLLSEAEQKMIKEQRTLEAQHIIELAQEKIRHTWHIHNKGKVKAFHDLYERALLFAEENSMNVLIETDSTTGRIKLLAPFLHFGVLTPDSNKETLLALIEGADSFMIQNDKDMLRIDFDYTLTTSIER